ncbi:FliH/SctL family protein [Sulfoacidibacillus thermotolerans]|uniref:Flagellar assembly protein FliH/Type III secretion system HrpE domain-containing protein n=1 Tax=Sulfoacidibacillus thermotolerans TaxID=1765684 RepID=A0A2U3DA77_SULT2|nr:FliH/SctL family protein [Sulfoacidibacillus thermotolerans]PWI58187.1 hypothetical protein BM613_04445 [Sulfoacidibacillus thermotolerans]
MSKILRPRSQNFPSRKIEAQADRSVVQGSNLEDAAKGPDVLGFDQVAAKERQIASLETQIHEYEDKLEELKAKAKDALEQNRVAAQQLLDQAQQEAQVLLAQAKKTGEAAGYQAGEIAAREAWEDLLAQARRTLEFAEQERRERVRSSEAMIVALAIEIAQKIVELHLEVDGKLVSRLLSDLLLEVDKAKRIEVRVAPSDLEQTLEQRGAYERILSHQAELLIVPDGGLSKGDVVIVSEHGTVDSRISTRFAEVERVLTQCVRDWEKSGESDG